MKTLFAFLQRDRVDDALALQALEAGLDHAPLRRVDHDRHARDVGLGRDQVQEARHRGFGIDQALVHVDVEDLRAARDLLARDLDRFLVAIFLDQLAELRAAGDVRALADVDEQEVGRDDQRLETGEARVAWRVRVADVALRVMPLRAAARGSARGATPRTASAIACDVRRRGAAAAADEIDEARARELADDRGHVLGRFVVFAERIRQAGVRMRADAAVGDAGEHVDVLAQLLRAERAVEADRERPRVAASTRRTLRPSGPTACGRTGR